MDIGLCGPNRSCKKGREKEKKKKKKKKKKKTTHRMSTPSCLQVSRTTAAGGSSQVRT